LKPTKTGKIKPTLTFDFDLEMIHNYWKSLPIYEDALAYLQRCQTESLRCAEDKVICIYNSNNSDFKLKCDIQGAQAISFSNRDAMSLLKIQESNDATRICFQQALNLEFDELEQDRLARYKESLQFYRLDWQRSLEELRKLFEMLANGSYIRMPFGINETIINTCLFHGKPVKYNSINTISNYASNDDKGDSLRETFTMELKKAADTNENAFTDAVGQVLSGCDEIRRKKLIEILRAME
jgi:hypothetical protein